jgi:hypothetical protein
MIVVQKKVGKVGNNLIEPALTIVAKHYATLEYIEEDEEEPIAMPKKEKEKDASSPFNSIHRH